MTRQMTTYSAPKMPAPMGRDLSTTIAKFKNRLEEHPGPYRHFSICESQAPTGIERQAMESRRDELKDALAPGNPEAIANEVRLLKAGFPNYGVDQVSAQVQVRIYVEALASFPIWAVQEARCRFRDGRNATPWRPSECPTSAQMAAECRAIVEPVRDELTPLNDVLDAQTYPEPDPGYEKRLAAVMKWEKDIRPTMAAKEQTKPKEDPQDALNRIKSEGWGDVQVSDAIRATLPNMKKGQAA